MSSIALNKATTNFSKISKNYYINSKNNYYCNMTLNRKYTLDQQNKKSNKQNKIVKSYDFENISNSNTVNNHKNKSKKNVVFSKVEVIEVDSYKEFNKINLYENQHMNYDNNFKSPCLNCLIF